MNLKQKRLSGMLSFLMPGLGQLYLGDLPATAVFFIGFVFLFSTRFCPLWALAAALHAFFSKNRRGPDPRDQTWRLFCYCAVGFIGFFGWMITFSSFVLPFGLQNEMNHRVERVAAEVKRFNAEKKRLPKSLDELAVSTSGEKKLPPFLLDPWRRPFEIEVGPDSFQIRSWGKDGVRGTSDDFIYAFSR